MYVKLTNNGLFTGKDIVDSLYPYLNNQLLLKDDITLEDLFDILYEYRKEVNEIFLSFTRGHDIEPFYEEIKKESLEANPFSELKFHWRVDNYEYENDDLEIEKELYTTVDMTLIKLGDKDNYSFNFNKLNDIKSVLITLDSSFIIHDKKFNPIFESTKNPTLYEFLGSFLNDLTFDGYPNQRDERAKSLFERIDDIDETDLEDATSWEEFRLEMYEKQLTKLIQNEKYEKAEIIQNRINELKEKINKK